MRTIVICDDVEIERLLLKEILCQYFEEINEEVSIIEYASGETLVADVEEGYLDMELLFLDIYMKKLNKIAGTNSIIVALWDVDDWVSEYLIRNFYTNYLNGSTKREALKEAQRAVKTYRGMMPDNIPRNLELPKYWAPFILIDGID